MNIEAKLLNDEFDAVIMLTWSNWKTEPRSNRYHYTSRFAKTLPVLFVQPWLDPGSSITLEPTEIEGVELVHTNAKAATSTLDLQKIMITEFRTILEQKKIRRPLFWIYDTIHYEPILDAFPNAYRVYHATEDYFSAPHGWDQDVAVIGASVARMLRHIDFVVAVTRGVLNSIRENGEYDGPGVVIENGCDAQFYLDRVNLPDLETSSKRRKSAIFQGGINSRLDYSMLLELVANMPDWDFVFYGKAIDSRDWTALLKKENVIYGGLVDQDALIEAMCEASVGIIPYIQSSLIAHSLPLKAFEYCASGLPVVTVPIEALKQNGELFNFATTADEFEFNLRKFADTRFDSKMIEMRQGVAIENSYDNRFVQMEIALLREVSDLRKFGPPLNVAILYDSETSMHVGTIKDHLNSFGDYSCNNITYIPGTTNYWRMTKNGAESNCDFNIFDVVIVHYSLRTAFPGTIDSGIIKLLEKYDGYKVLYIQDEYDGILNTRAFIQTTKIDLVYTCVPMQSVHSVYPAELFPITEFLQTLTGYIPEGENIERFCPPISERPLAIAYRGRELPAIYGKLGHEKFIIGEKMKEIAEQRGIPADIEVKETKRIYGSSWMKFLGSARATLGTESGSNIFDFDGTLGLAITKLTDENPNITFDEIWEAVLAPHEEIINMRQVSPKIFEAIRLRTALILFEGGYSGVVKANRHYIPLNKDFSNVDEVFDKLSDDTLVSEMTERAYQDVIASGLYSYRKFVENFDSDLKTRVISRMKNQLWVGPTLIVENDGSTRQALPLLPLGLRNGSANPLGNIPDIDVCGLSFNPIFGDVGAAIPDLSRMPGYSGLRWLWFKIPSSVQQNIISMVVLLRVGIKRISYSISYMNGMIRNSIFRVLRRLWHILPQSQRFGLFAKFSTIRRSIMLLLIRRS